MDNPVTLESGKREETLWAATKQRQTWAQALPFIAAALGAFLVWGDEKDSLGEVIPLALGVALALPVGSVFLAFLAEGLVRKVAGESHSSRKLVVDGPGMPVVGLIFVALWFNGASNVIEERNRIAECLREYERGHVRMVKSRFVCNS